MSLLTIGTAHILAHDHDIDLNTVRSRCNGITIGTLHFPHGTTTAHANMVLDCVGKTDEVSINTLKRYDASTVTDCNDCKYCGSVGGFPDGQDMFVCEIEDAMTDADVEQSNEGRCPKFERKEE